MGGGIRLNNCLFNGSQSNMKRQDRAWVERDGSNWISLRKKTLTWCTDGPCTVQKTNHNSLHQRLNSYVVNKHAQGTDMFSPNNISSIIFNINTNLRNHISFPSGLDYLNVSATSVMKLDSTGWYSGTVGRAAALQLRRFRFNPDTRCYLHGVCTSSLRPCRFSPTSSRHAGWWVNWLCKLSLVRRLALESGESWWECMQNKRELMLDVYKWVFNACYLPTWWAEGSVSGLYLKVSRRSIFNLFSYPYSRTICS